MVAAGACTSSAPAPPACVTVNADCKPQYDPPTFATIQDKIFRPTCATGTGTCHTADAAKGGLVLADPDDAYRRLLGQDGSHARVTPRDPACSLLTERLLSKDPDFHMPPGSTSLTDGEVCTIVKWIANGAER